MVASLVGVAGIPIMIWFIWESLQRGNMPAVLLLGLPGLLFCGYGFILAFRFKITITEHYVEKLGLLRRRVPFSEVGKVEFRPKQIILHWGFSHLALDSTIGNRDEVFRIVIDRVKRFPKVRVVGDEDMIAAYWGPKH
jgi:hypothetical protein